MLKKTIALLVTACALGSPVTAQPSTRLPEKGPVPYWCRVLQTLEGNPNYFLWYGRDSWSTKGEIICNSPANEIKQKVEITFQSLNAGYGASTNSKIALNLTVWTQTVPFRFHQLISGLVDNTLVHWQFSNENFDLVGSVWIGSQVNAAQSLTLGRLEIRPLED